MSKYDDIINLPHYRSKTRSPMPIEARAAQFAPFAALSGHSEAIEETARFTDTRLELTEHEQHELSLRLQMAMTLYPRPVVSITYFCPDKIKNSGIYKKIFCRITKIDDTEGFIKTDCNVTIPLNCVVGIDSNIF